MGHFWFNKGMAFLPISMVIWTFLTFATSYMIAVFKGDVDAGLPYISDTGARMPESSVFGMMLNISACLALSSMYVRYKQVNGFLENMHERKYKLINYSNKLAMFLGVWVCFGMSLVANFQETSVLAVHVVGALLTFFLGTVYELIDSFITFKMHPEINDKTIFYVRLTIATLSLMVLIAEMAVGSGITKIKFHWNPNDPGFSVHIASTVLEWCLAVTFLSYFFTFIRDFQLITLSASFHLHQESLHHDFLRGELINESDDIKDDVAKND